MASKPKPGAAEPLTTLHRIYNDTSSTYSNTTGDETTILRHDPKTQKTVINKSAYARLHRSLSAGNHRRSVDNLKGRFEKDEEVTKARAGNRASLGSSLIPVRVPPVPPVRTSVLSSAARKIPAVSEKEELNNSKKEDGGGKAKDENSNVVSSGGSIDSDDGDGVESVEVPVVVRPAPSVESIDRIARELEDFEMDGKPKERKRSGSFRKLFSGGIFGGNKDKKKKEEEKQRARIDNSQNESRNLPPSSNKNQNQTMVHNDISGQGHQQYQQQQQQQPQHKPLPPEKLREVEQHYAEMHINRFNQIRQNFTDPKPDYLPMDAPRKKASISDYISMPVKKYIDTSSSASTESSERPVTTPRINGDSSARDTPPRAQETSYQNLRLVSPKAAIPLNSERPLPNPYQNEKSSPKTIERNLNRSNSKSYYSEKPNFNSSTHPSLGGDRPNLDSSSEIQGFSSTDDRPDFSSDSDRPSVVSNRIDRNNSSFNSTSVDHPSISSVKDLSSLNSSDRSSFNSSVDTTDRQSFNSLINANGPRFSSEADRGKGLLVLNSSSERPPIAARPSFAGERDQQRPPVFRQERPDFNSDRPRVAGFQDRALGGRDPPRSMVPSNGSTLNNISRPIQREQPPPTRPTLDETYGTVFDSLEYVAARRGGMKPLNSFKPQSSPSPHHSTPNPHHSSPNPHFSSPSPHHSSPNPFLVPQDSPNPSLHSPSSPLDSPTKSVESSKLRLPPNREIYDTQPRVTSPIPSSKVSAEKIIATELLRNSRSPTPPRKPLGPPPRGEVQRPPASPRRPGNADYINLRSVQNGSSQNIGNQIASGSSQSLNGQGQAGPPPSQGDQKVITNAEVHVGGTALAEGNRNSYASSAARSPTPVDLRMSAALKLSPQKDDIRKSVEEFYWKELRKLKEDEDLRVMQQVSSGYFEDPIRVRRSRSLSPSQQAAGRRSLSLPRTGGDIAENPYGRMIPHQVIPEDGALIINNTNSVNSGVRRNLVYEPLPYQQQQQMQQQMLQMQQLQQMQQQGFARNAPERRTVGGSPQDGGNGVYRPIFRRGSLTRQDLYENQQYVNGSNGSKKAVSFSSSQAAASQAWPTRNGYTQSPPQRRLDRRESAVGDDEVFLPNNPPQQQYGQLRPPNQQRFEPVYGGRVDYADPRRQQQIAAVRQPSMESLQRHHVQQQYQQQQQQNQQPNPQEIYITRNQAQQILMERQRRLSNASLQQQQQQQQQQLQRREIVIVDDVYGRSYPQRMLPPNNNINSSQLSLIDNRPYPPRPVTNPIYSSRQSINSEASGYLPQNYPPRQITVSNRYCDMYGQIHDGPPTKTGILMGQLQRPAGSPMAPRYAGATPQPPPQNFVRNTRLTASANDMGNRVPNQQSFDNRPLPPIPNKKRGELPQTSGNSADPTSDVVVGRTKVGGKRRGFFSGK